MEGDGARQHGFTLLEVVVAFVIAGLALAVLFRAVVESRGGSRLAGHYMEALSRARSRMAALDAAPLAAGDRQGDDGGGFRWRTRTVLLESGPPTPAGTAALWGVSVAVTWRMDGGERVVQLDTRRLGAAPPRPP